jgi:hypothetical protein
MAETLTDRIQKAIDFQTAEVARLTQVATVELPAAQKKLNQLENLKERATPTVETFFGNLLSAKIVS